jgi:anti-anti-sigma factor
MDGAVDAQGRARIAPAGELDLVTIAPVRACVDAAIERGATSIVFDLEDVTFLDSTALALLSHTAMRVERVDVEHATDLVRRIIDITGLTGLLHLDGGAAPREFANVPASVAEVRAYVAGCLGDADDDVRETVKLLVSELATNAVSHAATTFTVAVECTQDRIRVRITDTGAGRPQVQPIDPTAPDGRGLRIVESLAESWGIEHRDDGKTVWFVIPTGTKTAS